VNRSTAPIKVISEAWAYLLTPTAIIVGNSLFGLAAAVRFNILDQEGDFIAGAVASALLLAAIQILPLPSSHKRALSILWLIRVGVAMGMMLPYEAHYSLDANVYYARGILLNDPWAWFGFGHGTSNVTAIIGLLSNVTQSYSAIKLVFSFTGLAAVYTFYRAVRLALGRESLELLYLLGIFPSILFWSSILGKDPITLLGIAVFCYGAVGVIAGYGLSMLVFVIAGLIIASFIRVWLGFVFLTPLLAAMVLTGRSSGVVKAGFLLLTVPVFLFMLQSFAERFSLETAEDLVARTDQISQAWAHGGSAQAIQGGFGSLQEMILFIPLGAFTALFRPLPGEILNGFGMLAGIENATLLGLILRGLVSHGIGWIRKPVLLWAVLTLVSWSAIYGFASFQNLGTAFRFHVQAAPILLMLGLYLNFGHGDGFRQSLPASRTPPDSKDA
jgi:hypothetical protein